MTLKKISLLFLLLFSINTVSADFSQEKINIADYYQEITIKNVFVAFIIYIIASNIIMNFTRLMSLSTLVPRSILHYCILDKFYIDNYNKGKPVQNPDEYFKDKIKNIQTLIQKHPQSLSYALWLLTMDVPYGFGSSMITFSKYLKNLISLKKSMPDESNKAAIDEIIAFLLASGLKPLYRDQVYNGPCIITKTALSFACRVGDYTTVELLLKDYQLNPNNEDHYTRPNYCGGADIGYERLAYIYDPLLIASYNNDLKMAQLLTDHNTNTHPFLDAHTRCNCGGDCDCFNFKNTAAGMAINNKNIPLLRHFMDYTLEKNESGCSFNYYKNIYQALAMFPLSSDITTYIKKIYAKTISNSIIDECFLYNKKTWRPNKYNPNYDKQITRLSHKADNFHLYLEKKEKLKRQTKKNSTIIKQSMLQLLATSQITR